MASCEKIVNIKDEIIISDAHYHKYKCCVCLDLIKPEEKIHYLHTRKCCEDGKLCKGCYDILKGQNCEKCPNCRKDKYIYSYKLTTTKECLEWIYKTTSKDCNNYFIKDGGTYLIKDYFEMLIRISFFRYLEIKYDTVNDTLETDIFFNNSSHISHYSIIYDDSKTVITNKIDLNKIDYNIIENMIKMALNRLSESDGQTIITPISSQSI